MSLKITVQYNLKAFDQFHSPALKRAITKALNKTITSLRTQAKRDIRQRIKLKASIVHRGLTLYRASHKHGSPQASLRVSAKPVPLGYYQARQTKKKGVSVNIKGQRKYLPHAFIATMRAGHRGVFKRLGKQSLPIKALYSTRLTDVIQDDDIISGLATKAGQQFKIELERAVKLMLQKHFK